MKWTQFFGAVGLAATVGQAAASIYETGEVAPEDISVESEITEAASDRVYSPLPVALWG